MRDYGTVTAIVMRALFVILGAALAARLAWLLLAPLVYPAAVLLGIVTFAWWLFAGPRYRRW